MKLIKILLSVILLALPVSTHACFESELLPGDIVMLRPNVVQTTPELDVPAWVYEFLCPNIDVLWVHVDLYMGDGLLMTATPNHGAGATSTLSGRLDGNTWNKALLIRNPSLDVEEALRIADNLEGAYDWIGYYLHVLDLIFSCSEDTFFRNFRIPWGYHCASFVFTAVGIDEPHIKTPFDITNEISDGGSDWEIVDECDL